MDRRIDSQTRLTIETNQEETWIALRQFYDKNQASINRSRNVDISKGQFQEDLDQVLEASQVLLNGLVALANTHPILGVAIFAFHGIIKLDITRRENNRKVLAVKLQMQSMMSAMFQMCELKHIHVLNDSQKEVQRAQLQELVKVIADEITQCGSDLNYYSDRKLLSKLIKAKTYERRLAEHVETFVQRRSELQTTIAAYIGVAIDAANIEIGQVGQAVALMDDKIDSLLAVFQRLSTNSERELRNFIDEHDGVENCLNTDDLLKTLLAKTGQPIDSFTETRKILRAELSEDLDKVLSRNLSRFENLLNVQNTNLERMSTEMELQSLGIQDNSMKLEKLVNTSILILEEGKLIKKAVGPSTRIKLKDPELQHIWDRMGLSGKRSVKAKQFVLTFRDCLMTGDHSMSATPDIHSALSLDPEMSSVLPLHENGYPASVEDTESDAWVLKHINASRMQAIIEAMDEDGSGFISVHDANKFALSRPKGMNLLHWIAYWATGWQYNVTDYRNKIYRIMQELHKLSATVLSVNRKITAMYLDDWSYFRIEGILRFITPTSNDVPRDPQLIEIAKSISLAQEEKLKRDLDQISYVLRSPADVALVIGNGRMETSLLPLLYLLLERHLAVFRIAQNRILAASAFHAHCSSIESIMYIYDERMRRLRDISRQFNRDTEVYFSNFAYGMFLSALKWTNSRKAIGNTLLSYGDDDDDEQMSYIFPDLAGEPTEVAELDVLVCDSAIDFQGLDDISDETSHFNSGSTTNEHPPEHDTPNAIEGHWVVSFSTDKIPPLECIIRPLIQGRFVTKGRSYAVFDILGSYEEHTGIISFRLQRIGCVPLQFKGVYDKSKDIITGWWVLMSFREGDPVVFEETEPAETPDKKFTMTRHSIPAFRFRTLLDASSTEVAQIQKSAAKRRWEFAIEAILFTVQEKLWSWGFMRNRISERNEWIELGFRRSPLWELNATRGYITDEGEDKFLAITNQLHPSVASLYITIGSYLTERRWYDVGNIACDVCDQEIIFRRYMCITCVEDDFSNWVDFCVDGDCSESKIFEYTDFVHNSSHTLLRCTERILAYELPTIASRAELRSEKIKKLFRLRSSTTKNEPRKSDSWADAKMPLPADNRESTANPTCSSCHAQLALPCWACAICIREILLCLKCEKDLQSPLNDSCTGILAGHSSRHHLLRINDSTEAKAVKLKTHNRQLEDLEKRINTGLDNLETRINNQHGQSEDRIGVLQENMDARLTTLGEKVDSIEAKLDSLVVLMQHIIAASK